MLTLETMNRNDVKKYKNELIAALSASLSSPSTTVLTRNTDTSATRSSSMKKSQVRTYLQKETVDDFEAYNKMKSRYYQSSASTKKKSINIDRRRNKNDNIKRSKRSLNLTLLGNGDKWNDSNSNNNEKKMIIHRRSDKQSPRPHHNNHHNTMKLFSNNNENNKQNQHDVMKSSTKKPHDDFDNDNDDDDEFHLYSPTIVSRKKKKLQEFVSI